MPGEPDTDPYKPTPDELFARGKTHFDAGRFPRPARRSSRSSPAIPCATISPRTRPACSSLINIRADQPRKIVTYFEVVKEKAPELFLTFEQLLAIGKAYREINESERAMIVWRGLIEASYLEDARVGELLRQRGKTLEAIAYLLELWRSYPNTASIESDFFGLSQVLAQTASQAINNPGLRRELAAAGITRSELLLQTIRMIQVFLSQSPKNPLADEASLALVAAFTELEDFQAVDRLAARFAKLYPKSTYLDSFQYSEALANFHLGRYDRAIEVAQTIARATYKDAAGADQPSPNKWQAIYILGQIHDARRQPARRSNSTARWPTGSATPLAPSSPTPARTSRSPRYRSSGSTPDPSSPPDRTADNAQSRFPGDRRRRRRRGRPERPPRSRESASITATSPRSTSRSIRST